MGQRDKALGRNAIYELMLPTTWWIAAYYNGYTHTPLAKMWDKVL